MLRDQTALTTAQASELLSRQDALQQEARQIVETLGLHERLGQAGQVSEHGSSISGLMAWRDIDFGVTSPGLTTERAFEIMLPLLQHPQTARVRYQNETGPRTFMGDQRNERLFFMVYYDHTDGETWKIDIAFWLWPEPRGESHAATAIRDRLTGETRVAILWIKDLWHGLAAYPSVVGSVDIYTAVLDHGVRTPGEFDAYLAERGKPPLDEATLLPGVK
jgi:hypothetical protein